MNQLSRITTPTFPTCRETTRLHDIPAEQEGNNFSSMMSSASIGTSNSTAPTSAGVINGGPVIISTNNGVSEKPKNGVAEKKYGVRLSEEKKKILKKRFAPTDPEVSNWTSIMTKGMFFNKKQPETVDQVYEDLRDMSSDDCEQVDQYWDQLMPVVSYLGTEKVAKVYDALRVAYRAHRGQMRKSGEPFIIHPVEVSLLLAGLKMDSETVMSGLLHDTVEDTDLTFELVEGMFGKVVRSIVEGETKVSKLPKIALTEYADEQAENLRQMFVAMTDDYRIIIVKLADRLHNMRTLRHMKPEKQIKISRETLDIFAPLAHRMGIWQFKSELEDTAFMYLYPQEYKRLNRRLLEHQEKFQETLDKSQKLLKARLNSDPTLGDQAVKVKVSGRTKEIYSLWHKMETKNERNLDHIVDVVALRVIITPKTNPEDDENVADQGVWLCYHVLGLVQHLEGFQPVPTRVKDYISFPKPNGYQSLHTALIYNGQKIEVQIRTSMMHQVAEYGMASHWAYKDETLRHSGKEDLYNTPWLSSIKEWQNEKLNARDFVDSVRSELLGKRVFVFLRNGKILNLARGATAVDAAFQIHTEVGLNMHGVEINGKPVSSTFPSSLTIYIHFVHLILQFSLGPNFV
jgi:GTP pyrophosphokinase